MSTKERRRLVVFGQVKAGQLTVASAGRVLGLSERQARRVWKRYKSDGDAGLIHRLRGQSGNRRIDPHKRDRAIELYRSHYDDFGPTLASEYLSDRHDLTVDDQTLRRWLMAAGLWQRRRRSKPKRHRRPRKACFGELVQFDGSPHAWFEGRAASCCLMVMVDDATGLTVARFFESETTVAAMTIFQVWAVQHGLPQAVYPDRHSIHRRNDKQADEIEARTGKRPPTQFGRAMEDLGVKLIWADSPQAKGRVERKNGTLQDRLVKALRIEQISDIAAANRYLEHTFLPSFNQRFSVTPAQTTDLHTVCSKEVLTTALCVQETRMVGQDQCISWQGQVLQLLPGAKVPSLAGKRVTAQRSLNGQIQVLWRQQVVKHMPLAQRPKPVKSSATLAQRVAEHKPPSKPSAEHPWRAPAITRGLLAEGSSAAARATPSPPLQTPRPAA